MERKPDGVPDYALVLSLDGVTRFHQYDMRGIPLPVMARYWTWEGGRHVETLDMNPEELQALEELNLRASNGSTLSVKYKDWGRLSAK